MRVLVKYDYQCAHPVTDLKGSFFIYRFGEHLMRNNQANVLPIEFIKFYIYLSYINIQLEKFKLPTIK